MASQGKSEWTMTPSRLVNSRLAWVACAAMFLAVAACERTTETTVPQSDGILVKENAGKALSVKGTYHWFAPSKMFPQGQWVLVVSTGYVILEGNIPKDITEGNDASLSGTLGYKDRKDLGPAYGEGLEWFLQVK